MCDEPGSRLLWETANAGTAALAQCLGTRQAPDAGPCASCATLQAARSDGDERAQTLTLCVCVIHGQHSSLTAQVADLRQGRP